MFIKIKIKQIGVVDVSNASSVGYVDAKWTPVAEEFVCIVICSIVQLEVSNGQFRQKVLPQAQSSIVTTHPCMPSKDCTFDSWFLHNCTNVTHYKLFSKHQQVHCGYIL